MSGLDICGSLCDLWKPPPTFFSCKHLSLESTCKWIPTRDVCKWKSLDQLVLPGRKKGKPILSFCLVVVLLPAMRAIITIDPDSFFPKDVFPAVASQKKSYTQFLLHQYFSNLNIKCNLSCQRGLSSTHDKKIPTEMEVVPRYWNGRERMTGWSGYPLDC